MKGHEGRTLRNGLPRFVVFIMCDEVDWGASAGGMAYGTKGEKKERNEEGELGGETEGEGQGGGWRAGRGVGGEDEDER